MINFRPECRKNLLMAGKKYDFTNIGKSYIANKTHANAHFKKGGHNETCFDSNNIERITIWTSEI